jgi:hypothetical protein
MKTSKLLIAASLIVLIVSSVFAAAESPFINFAPAKFGKKAKITVAGKENDYYLLQGSTQIDVKLIGPCQLKVVSRLVMPQNDNKPTYHFFGKCKGSTDNYTFEHETKLAENVSMKDSASVKIAADRSKIITVPAGEQIYSFFLTPGANEKVYLHFSKTSNGLTKPKKTVAATPIVYSSKVELLANEKTQTYYRIGHGEKVSLKLTGPTTLKGFCRIEYDSSMTGDQKWRMQVTEDSKIKGTYPFTAPKSHTTFYSEKCALVPSRAEAFFVEVPAGEHMYEFTVPENHRTVLLKFSLPHNENGK